MKRIILTKATLLTLFALIFSICFAHAQNWDQIIKATAGDRDTLITDNSQIHLGYSVSVSGDYAVAGSDLSIRGVYIYHKIDGNWKQIQHISPPETGQFGFAVAMEGDYMIIGNPKGSQDSLEVNDLTNAGSAFIYKKDYVSPGSWGLVKRIKASNPMAGDQFGFSVSISAGYAVASAPYEDEDASAGNNMSNTGSVFIFKKDAGGTESWTQVNKFTAPVRSADSQFGRSVSINGNTLVVGTPYSDEHGIDSGSAHLLELNTGSNKWEYKQIISAPVSEAGDIFGFSVQVSGTSLIVGALGESHNASETGYLMQAGSAYIFEKGSIQWDFAAKLVSPNRRSLSRLGFAVAIDGQNAVVTGNSTMNDIFVFSKNETGWSQVSLLNTIYATSLPISIAVSNTDVFTGNCEASALKGSLLIYRKAANAWSNTQTIFPLRVTPEKLFGYSVAVKGNYAIIGAPFDQVYVATGTNKFGAAYIFKNENGTWRQIKKISPPALTLYQSFGASVAIDGTRAVVGRSTIVENGKGAIIGGAYVYEKNQGGTDNWGLVKNLKVPPNASTWFGSSVSISGDFAVISDPYNSTNMFESGYIEQSGSVFIYGRNQGGENAWGLAKKLTAPTRVAVARYGFSIGFDGTYLIIGSPRDHTDANDLNPVPNSGNAFIYGKDQGGTNQWGLIQKISSPTRITNHLFGSAVSVSGDYLLIANGTYFGFSYIFKKNQSSIGWSHLKTFTTPGITSWLQNYASIEGNYAVVGSPAKNGSAYVFDKNLGGTDNWGQSQVLTSINPVTGDRFGMGVAISGDYILVGVPSDDENANETNYLSNAGSAYFFRRAGALPVTLIAFNADKKEQTAEMSWATSAEVDSRSFEISRSRNGKAWETIGNVDAAGSNGVTTKYFFTDNHPFRGENLYRLKMIDQDGSFTLSQIRSLLFEKNLVLYPNPASDKIYLDETDVYSLEVLSITGQKVMSASVTANSGVSISHLLPGMYMMKIRNQDGEVHIQKMWIKR